MSSYWLSITIQHCSIPLSVFVSHCSDREKPAFHYPQCIYIFVQFSNSLSISNFTVVIASSLSAQPASLLPWPLGMPTPPWGPPLTAFLSWDRGTQSLQAVFSPSAPVLHPSGTPRALCVTAPCSMSLTFRQAGTLSPCPLFPSSSAEHTGNPGKEKERRESFMSSPFLILRSVSVSLCQEFHRIFYSVSQLLLLLIICLVGL